MIARIGCMYSDDWDFNDYAEGETFTIPKDVIRANYTILEDEDADENECERVGDLPTTYRYQLMDGQLCAWVDDKWRPCEDDALEEYFMQQP